MVRCTICGEIKKTGFRCSRCGLLVCVNCFNFVSNKCSNCDIMDYNERYADKIAAYKEGEKCLDVDIAGLQGQTHHPPSVSSGKW